MEDGPDEMVKMVEAVKQHLLPEKALFDGTNWLTATMYRHSKVFRVRLPVSFKATHAPEPISDDFGSTHCASMASFPVQDPWDCPQEEKISDDIGFVHCSSMGWWPENNEKSSVTASDIIAKAIKGFDAEWDCPQEEKISYGDATYHTSSLERRSADVLDEILEEVKVTEKPKPAPAPHAKGIPTKLVTTMGDPRRMGLA